MNDIKENENTYRGVKDTKFIWHGCQSDPEIEWNGYRFNYWDIDDSIYYDFIEDYPEYKDKDIPDGLFNQYVQQHNYLIYEYMDVAIKSGSVRKTKN